MTKRKKHRHKYKASMMKLDDGFGNPVMECACGKEKRKP